MTVTTDGIRLTGLDETIAALRALPAEFGSKGGGPIRKALYRAALPMRKFAESKAPIDTGNLSANVYIYRDRDPKGSTGATERYVIGVRTKRNARQQARLNQQLGRVSRNLRTRGDAYYWFMVEFGTSKQRAQPFMRPAFELHKNIAVSIFTRELRTMVAAAVNKARGKSGG